MIKINENKISTPKLTSVIKTKVKIKSYYYFIQIYIDSFAGLEKLSFLIKSKKDKERNAILFRRIFNYNELINYNKYFKNFASLEDIFINIAQCIEEKKFSLNITMKCLSLIFRLYISKIKKYVNISIILNEHKNLRTLSMNNSKKKEIKKIMLGIQNDEELSYAIYDIRQRLKNLELNQSMINNNVNKTYRNNNINLLNNNLQQYINNSPNNQNNPNIYENLNNNAFQIKYYNNNTNKKQLNNKISGNSSMNNYNEESNLYNQNNSFQNKKIINIKNNTDNLFSKNIKVNQKHKITGVNELIKKINEIESTINSKDKKTNNLENKLISNETSYVKNKYFQESKKKENTIKNSNYNKSVEIQRRNNISLYNNNNNNNNITQISLMKKNHIKALFNKEQSMNGTQIIDDNNININNISNINTAKQENNKMINIYNQDIKENNLTKYINKKNAKNIKEKNNNFDKKVKKEEDSEDEEEQIIIKKNDDDNGYLSKVKTEKVKNVKIKNDNLNKSKTNKTKVKKVYFENDNDNNYNDNYYNKNTKIKVKEKEEEKEEEKENGNNNDNIEFLNGKKSYNNVGNYSEKESDKQKSIIKEDSKDNNESRNDKIIPKIKIKKISSIEKDKNYNNNKININSSVNSLSSKPIIKPNLNRSISSSTSNVIKSPRKLPIYTPEKISKYINSNIIFREEEIKMLENKLSKNNKNINVYFDLLYRATRDGDNDTIIKKLTLGYEKVLTLFYTNEGARFGVYIQRKKNHYIKAKERGEKPGTSFIFGLNNLVIYDIYKNKYGKGDYNQVLCFGCLENKGSNGTKWMIYTPQNNFLQQKCVMCSGVGLYHEIDIEQIVGPSEYTIKEVEIFNIEFEQEEDVFDD